MIELCYSFIEVGEVNLPYPAKAVIQVKTVSIKTVLLNRASMAAMTLAAILLLGGCAATQDVADWVSDTIGGSAAGSQQSVALPAPSYLSETPARTVTPRKRLQCVP